MDGRVIISGIASRNILYLPLSATGSVSFEATTERGDHVRIDADSISAEVRGASQHLEPFGGSTDV
jgi:hypothetical protein